MIEWVKDLLYNKSRFERLSRVVIMAGALYAIQRKWVGPEIGSVLAALGLAIPAGEKNQK